MKKFLFLVLLLMACQSKNTNIETLRDGFQTPPATARPGVYWYFMDGNFSRPVNPRPTYLVLYNKKGAAYEFPTGTDARSFEPWEEVEVKLAGKLPDNAPAGPYFAALWLPDEEESIKYRPEYAITLAEGTQREVLGGRVLNRIE